MNNGGIIAGVQVGQDLVNAALKNQRDIAEGQAADILGKMPQATAYQQSVALTNMSTQLFTRSKDILGVAGQASMEPILRQVSTSATALNEAISSGQPQEVINALLDRHQKLVAGVSEHVDSKILASTNGDKITAGAVSNFVRGVPMTEGASIEVLTRAAIKGNLPHALSMGPEAKTVFSAAQKLISENRYKGPNGTNPRTEAELQQIVADKLGPQVQALMGNPRLNRVLDNLPSYAKQANNPLGQIKPEWWTRTLTAAHQSALGQAATKLTRLGIKDGETTLTFTPEIVGKIMAGSFQAASTPNGAAMVKAVEDNSGFYTAAETQMVVQRLEAIPPLTAETTNSELFEDFLASPGLTNRLIQEEQTVRQNSFGDYLLGPMTQGATVSALSMHRQTVRSVNRARDDQGYADRQIDTSIFRASRGRLYVMAQAVPGIGSEGAQKLLPIIMQKVGQRDDISSDLEFINWLGVQKFEDPAVNAYAKRFVSEYPEISKWVPELHRIITQTRGDVRNHLTRNR
jgi:hypothetical protein